METKKLVDTAHTAAAVRAMREHLAESQSVFAARLGAAHTTIQRYERQGLPTLEDMCVYSQLVQIATQFGRPDLADTFRAPLVAVGALAGDDESGDHENPELARAMRRLRIIYAHGKSRDKKMVEDYLVLLERSVQRDIAEQQRGG